MNVKLFCAGDRSDSLRVLTNTSFAGAVAQLQLKWSACHQLWRPGRISNGARLRDSR
jgi:hypothetical protein